jgi:hypothetical protein
VNWCKMVFDGEYNSQNCIRHQQPFYINLQDCIHHQRPFYNNFA